VGAETPPFLRGVSLTLWIGRYWGGGAGVLDLSLSAHE